MFVFPLYVSHRTERQPSLWQNGANARAAPGLGGENAPGGGKGKAELPVWATLANAAGAAAVASWLTNPLDLAKLRLQVCACLLGAWGLWFCFRALDGGKGRRIL